MPLIPLTCVGNWEPNVFTGIPGGIPVRTNVVDLSDPPYNIGSSGEVSAILQQAIDDSSPGDILLMPAGNFTLTSGVSIPHSKPNITIRGAGMSDTIITGDGISVCLGIGQSPGVTTYDIDSVTRDDTVVTMADTSAISVGQIVRVLFENDDTVPVFSVYGFTLANASPIRCQHAEVLSKTGTTLTLDQPLAYTSSFAKLAVTAFFSGIGLEDFTLAGDPAVTQIAISYFNTARSWINRVKVEHVINFHVAIENCYQMQINESWIQIRDGVGSNGSGIRLNYSSSCLIYDNIIRDQFPLIEVNQGSCSNVVAYNFFADGDAQSINSNHGPSNGYNLYEGNIAQIFISDGYFGSETELIVYRNWIYDLYGITLKRFTRNACLVGNVTVTLTMGQPNLGNGSSIGTASLINGDPWEGWQKTAVLTTRDDDNNGVVTLDSGTIVPPIGTPLTFVVFRWGPTLSSSFSCTLTTSEISGAVLTIIGSTGVLPALSTVLHLFEGQSGYQELDEDVENTITLRGNFYTDGSPMDPMDGETLVDSLAWDSEPSFMSGFPWPPIDPFDPPGDYSIFKAADMLPAAARYLADLPDEAPEITTDPEIEGNPVEGQILTAIPGNVTGNPEPTRTWQWQVDDGGGFEDILGETSINYTPVEGDVGFDIRVAQTENNGIGSPDTAFSEPVTILEFTGDLLVVTQVANASPVTELWLRGALTSGVSAPLEYYLVQHSGPYPTQPDNNYVYARFGTPQDNVYVFQGTISEAEAIASVP